MRDVSQTTRVVERRREGLGLVQVGQDTLIVARGRQRGAHGESEIDGLLARVTRLRQMREGTERLLEVRDGLAVSRPCHALLPRLPAVRQGLGPHLAPQGMVRQALHLLGQLFRRRPSSASTMWAWSTRRRSWSNPP